MSPKGASLSPLLEGGQIGRPRLNSQSIHSAMPSRFATEQGEYVTGDLGSGTSRTCRPPVGVIAFGPNMNTLPAPYILRALLRPSSRGGFGVGRWWSVLNLSARSPLDGFRGTSRWHSRTSNAHSTRARAPLRSGPVGPLSCRQNLNLEVK